MGGEQQTKPNQTQNIFGLL